MLLPAPSCPALHCKRTSRSTRAKRNSYRVLHLSLSHIHSRAPTLALPRSVLTEHNFQHRMWGRQTQNRFSPRAESYVPAFQPCRSLESKQSETAFQWPARTACQHRQVPGAGPVHVHVHGNKSIGWTDTTAAVYRSVGHPVSVALPLCPLISLHRPLKRRAELTRIPPSTRRTRCCVRGRSQSLFKPVVRRSPASASLYFELVLKYCCNAEYYVLLRKSGFDSL